MVGRVSVAVVTGASSGIGAALCPDASAAGCTSSASRGAPAAAADEHEPATVSTRPPSKRRPPRSSSDIPASSCSSATRASRRAACTSTPPRNGSSRDANELSRSGYWSCASRDSARSFVVNVVSSQGSWRRPVLGLQARAARVLTLARGRARRGRRSVHTINPGFVETPGFPSAAACHASAYRLVAMPELVAGRILEAVEKGRSEIVVPRWYRPAAGLSRSRRPLSAACGRGWESTTLSGPLRDGFTLRRARSLRVSIRVASRN